MMSNLSESKFCFIPDEKEVFVIAEITQKNAAKGEAMVTVKNTKKIVTLKYENIVPIGSMEELDSPPTDLIKLVFVNRPGILHTLRTRFMQDYIYTSIGPILVALNPFKWISGIYEEPVMLSYKNGEANLSDRPHVFAVANDAYNDLQFGQNQSLIISGESGAGKTEATKQCLNYLAFLAGSSTGIQSKILKASPILEAWGNAKTLRNNNSSRFGKFIEIWFDDHLTITGSSNTTYILEKSRVVFQEKDERNYHVFYQLLKGASPDLLAELDLVDLAANPEKANFINQSGCIQIENVDDAADHREVNEAFAEIGFSPQEQKSLHAIIAGLLLLGNVAYECNPENPDESIVTADTTVWLERSAKQFGVEYEFVKKALLYKTIKSGNSRRTSVAYASYKLDGAYENKNALAKEIYKRCFDFIVDRINTLMGNDKTQATNMIGILDIFGFEIFQKNSFEQLCINLANEALQQHFNYNIFQAEMDVYIAEDVPVPPLEYKDNQDVLDLIMKKPLGLIPMLDEEGLVPKGSWEGFLNKYTKQHSKHARYKKAKLSNELGIVHYAGDVCYDASLFLVKNKDTLSADLVDVFSTATLPLLNSFFTEPEVPPPSSESSPKRAQSGAKMTVGKSFSLQLEKLIGDLNATKPRYIRCIKPNQVKKPNIFVPDLTNEQLTYSGVFEAVIIMQNGYPFRLTHEQFRGQYHMLVQDAHNHRLLYDDEMFLKHTSHLGSSTDDVPITPKTSTKSHRSFSRDQCIFMVNTIATANPGKELDKCFTGTTRTFYRSQQHNALVALRTSIIEKAILRLQTRTRTYITQVLAGSIRRAEAEWFSSLSSRKIEKIIPASEKVDALVGRLNKIIPGLNFQLDCTKIGHLYGKAFELEDKISPAIQSVLEETDTDIMSKYDRLEVMLKDLNTVNFTVQHRSATLSFKWEDKMELKEQAEKINAMGDLVKVKRKFMRGISSKNEVALEEAMLELHALRTAGKVEEEKFCVDECSQAQKIIEEAEVLFATLLDTVAAAVSTGRFTAERVSPGSLDLRIDVDPSALNAIISNHEREQRSQPEGFLPPVRVRALQLLCRQLRDIRVLARDKKWEYVWTELQQNWNSRECGNNSIENNDECSGYLMSEKFLPVEMKNSLLEEKMHISLVAINYFVVPQVQAAIDRNTVPVTPTLGTDVAVLQTEDLAKQIASADAYADYFDEDLAEFMDVAKDHLFYRTEVSSGDWGRITALNSRGSAIPTTHPDRANIRNYVKMFEAVRSITARVVEDKITGDPGAFDFKSIQVTGLAEACAAANSLVVKGKAWIDLLEAANTVRTARDLLQKEYFTEAWEFMQGLSTSSVWQAIATSTIEESADRIISEALKSAVAELKSYESEILHARAMKDIAAALALDGIGDENTDFSVGRVSANTLQTEIEAKSHQIIPTKAAQMLLEDCKMVVKLRTFAITSQWSEVEKNILAMHEKSEQFNRCHMNCQNELRNYYNRVFDMKVRAGLERAISSGKIGVLSGSDDNICDFACIETLPLQEAIAYSKQGFVLGVTTKSVLSVASGLYCLRTCVEMNAWEPSLRFFFANTATEDLAGHIATLDSDTSLAKARGSLASTIIALKNIEEVVQISSVTRAVEKTDVSNLCVVEVVTYLDASLAIASPIRDEVAAVKLLHKQRRCVLMLLLSAFTGRIKGTLDEFDCSDVVTKHIEIALEFVDSSMSELGNCPTVLNWAQAARYLLSVRQTIISATSEAPHEEPNLSDVFVVQDLQDILSSIMAGYPVKELKLVLNKLRDQTSFQELLQALNFGRPVFENGKMDVARVQHSHLQERLDTAKKNAVRSDRLDRLFFYIELTISMRKAVNLEQWELSEREKSNSEGASAMITVKRCLKEFEQARRFFSTPVPGVPPQTVIDEFRLMGREWERRLVKQRFATAFKAGAVTGQPLALSLTGLRTDLLEVEIARVEDVQSSAVEKDVGFEQYMQAGAELINIRKEASKVHASYQHPVKFAFPSDSLHTILDAPEFIPDAISHALAAVDRTTQTPYRFAEEWKEIDHIIANLQGCPHVAAAQVEMQLIEDESHIRAYMVSLLGVFHNAHAVAKSPRAQMELVGKLTTAQTEYDQRRAQRVSNSATGNRKSRNMRPSAVLEVMTNSAVVLLHFLRAQSNNHFDPHSREWREDRNYSKTPRLSMMGQNLSASYSMQQVLRSALRVQLHSKVQALVDNAIMKLEDAISKSEMLLAFSEAQYAFTGSVGCIKPSASAVSYMQHVIERVDRVGVQDPAVGKLHSFFVVHKNMRQAMQQADFATAFSVLDDFLGNGKRDLAFVLKVMQNKNYQVAAEGSQEFHLLAYEACDRAWQAVGEVAAVQDRIGGKRGALHSSEISWKKIDEVIEIMQSLPEVSSRSRQVHKICELVRNLRQQILGSGSYSGDENSRESSVAFQKLQFVQKRSEFGSVASKILNKFTECIVSSACQRVEGVTAVNLTWDHIDDLALFSQHVQPIIEAVNEKVDNDFTVSMGIKEEILHECELVNRHCESLQAGLALEAAIESGIEFSYGSDGLSLQQDREGRLVRTLAGATAQRWQLLGHPHEYWWACLTALTKSFLALMDQAGSGSNEVVLVRPGTLLFKTLLPVMYALIAQVNNITVQLKSTGYRKRTALPNRILDACALMRTAIIEHTTLVRLERIISADHIITHVAEDSKILKIEVEARREVLQIDKDEDLPRRSTYEQYGADLKLMISHAKVDTNIGKLLVDMLLNLVDLRIAVSTHRWYSAKDLCSSFHWVKEFASCHDIEVCQRFLRYKEYHRAIENSILCCSLPNVVGWTLHTASREIAQNINDAPLTSIIRAGHNKYGNLAVQYTSLSDLLSVGSKVLEVVDLVRKGLWVGSVRYSDEISGGSAGEGSRYISQECRAAPEALRQLVDSSHTLEPHMRTFIMQTAANLETELTVVQLEHLAQKTLRAAKFSGRPGELIIPEKAPEILNELCIRLEATGSLIKKFHPLRAAEQAAKLLIKVIDSHFSGDLAELSKYYDLMLYLCEIDCQPGVLSATSFPPIAAINDHEILRMDDSAFAHLISIKANPTSLPFTGQGSAHSLVGAANPTSDALVSYWNDGYAGDKTELQKLFVQLSRCAFTDAIALRTELRDIISLLHRHVVVESMFVEFLQVIRMDTPQVEPGALDLTLIHTDGLLVYLDKYSQYYPAGDKSPHNLGNILIDMCASLLKIRQGQLNDDADVITAGLEQAGAACLKENEFTRVVGAAPFGGITKNCFEHIAEEVEFADEDLDQRKLILRLKSALRTRGLPSSHYPFDISGIFVAELEAVYELCNQTPPACTEGRRLHQAVSILLVLRKYALRRDWTSMIEFYNNLGIENSQEVFLLEECVAEFESAKEIMMVSSAIELAIESYVAGYMGGSVGAIAPCGDIFFNVKEPKAAVALFEQLDESWLSPGVKKHFYTSKALCGIRSNTLMRNWENVLEAAGPAMDNHCTGIQPLVEICVPEVQLARDHSAYIISVKQARLALSTGCLHGTVGNVHVWDVEIDTLMQCYSTITRINCRRDDVLSFKAALEFIFRIRKAILLDQWINNDITHDYLTLLGSNFQLQDERVQNKTISAELIDHSVRLSTRIDDNNNNNNADKADLTEEEEDLPTEAAGATVNIHKSSSAPDFDFSLISAQAHPPPILATDSTLNSPSPVIPAKTQFENIASILSNWSEVKDTCGFDEQAIAEVDLAHQEMRHRTMVSLLLKNIHTDGIQGLPGQVDTSQAVTRLLEKAIVTATENSDVTMRGDCKGLLRDAKLLLMARRYRINQQWVELHHMLEEIELTLSAEASAEEAAAAVGDDSSTVSEEMVVKEYVRSIVKPVWQELQLLKYDTLFQLYLTNFKYEMARPSAPPAPDGTAPVQPQAASQERIDIIRTILESTESAAQDYPSPEFARLVEAEAAALELREFCRQNPNKSPQEIIHLVAQTKKRDEDAKQTSYMALLIHEISQMENVLDFPVNLKTIHREIVKGQKYFSCPIGQLETTLLDMEVITVAYNAAIPSLELFGTEKDHSFMKLAEVVINLRTALLKHGLNSAMLVLDRNEETLQDSLTRDEVERLRIEKENFEAGRLMEIGLRTGRYIDVLAIARMVHNYETRMAAKNAPPKVETNPLMNFGPEAKRASRRSAQRVSREVTASSMTVALTDSYNASSSGADAGGGGGSGRRSVIVGGKRRSVQVEEGTASEEFIEGVFKSINALNRAIAIANQVRVRSANTDYYLNAVQVILRLREYTVADNWDEVKRYLAADSTWQNLPITALEEIRACKEGLMYQETITRMSRAFYAGAIYGLPHEIDFDQISGEELIGSLEVCDEVQFTDPSALLLMEFAQRLVTVRHLILSDQWLDTAEDAAVVGDALQEASTKLRKSIYSHPEPLKHEVKRDSVDTCVEEFMEFQSTALPKLQSLLKVASQMEGESRVDISTILDEARLVLMHKSEHPEQVPAGPDGWVLQIWHAVLHVVLEINLAQQVIQYRGVLLRLIDAADSTPEAVKAYVNDRHHMHASVHPLMRNHQQHADVTLYGGGGAGSLGMFAAGGDVIFDISVLEAALQQTKDYLSFVGFETSEEMLKLQETCKMLVEFRSALNAQRSHELLLQLLMRTKVQAAKGFLSSENGIFEINGYISATAESVRIQNSLRQAIQSKHVHGPLDALQLTEVSVIDLQLAIDDALTFLARGGAALSIGVPHLLLQARVIHKLRSALLDSEWGILEYTIRCYETHASDWEVAGLEFQHIKAAFAFRTAMNQIRTYTSEFRSDDDLGHSLMCIDVDLNELNKIFIEINRLLHYSSPLLRPSTGQHFTDPENSVELAEEVVITSAFFNHISVVASVAVWKVFQSMRNSSWFIKQAIHDCEDQKIAQFPDPFLFGFFCLDNCNYSKNIRGDLTPSDITDGFMLSALARQETVFSVLVSYNWAEFPYNIRQFFGRIRNHLVDRFVRTDLKYYCKRGAAVLDQAGNLHLSNMNLQFLQITLSDATRAERLARTFCVKFRWSKETEKWLESAQIALKYRNSLLQAGAAGRVASLLRADGMMRGHTHFDPKLFKIHNELEVLEKYAQAHETENVIVSALKFVTAQSNNVNSHFADVALENPAVLHLFELATAPIPVADPSTYLLDMINIVCLSRDAIFAAMLGGQARFTPIIEELRDAIAGYPSAGLSSINIHEVVRVLTVECKRAYHAELLDFRLSSSSLPRKLAAAKRAMDPIHSHASAGQYIGSSKSPSKATATRSPRKPTTYATDTDKNSASGIHKLAEFTQKIISALCELLFFHQDEGHFSIGAKEALIDTLRSKVPVSARSEAPIHCYNTLRELASSMDQLYPIYEPRWAAALVIVVYYLRREITVLSFSNVAQTVNLSQDLVQFCKDIQLDRTVLAAHIASKHTIPRCRGSNSSSGGGGGVCRGKGNISAGSEQDGSPAALVLVKHLSSIAMTMSCTPFLVRSTHVIIAYDELSESLRAYAQSCTRSKEHTTALTLDNAVSGEEPQSAVFVLNSLPLGAVARSSAQMNMFLKAMNMT